MASVKVTEQLHVSPPPGSVPPTTIPLSFFDTIWLWMPPVQRLFFFRHPDELDLPALRHSLSLALRIFYLLAGRLTPSAGLPQDHVISYADGDSVPFTIAESDADFDSLAADHPRDVKRLHPLVPQLPAADEGGRRPVIALQVTFFRRSGGLCIGRSVHHAAVDGSSLAMFMKAWADIFRSGGDLSVVRTRPVYDRTLLGDIEGLKRDFLLGMEKLASEKVTPDSEVDIKKSETGRVVRSTFTLTQDQINGLRGRIMSTAADTGERPSTFAVACAYVLVCLTKARGNEGQVVHFGFAVDCRSRLDPPVPAEYFGNCIGAIFARANGSELYGYDGMAIAAKEIRGAIRRFQEDGVLLDAANWIPRFKALAGVRILSIAGGPRLRVYDTDFGWGPPKKVETISIETTGAVSLDESRGAGGGVEIGLAGPDSEVELFASHFEEGLRQLPMDRPA